MLYYLITRARAQDEKNNVKKSNQENVSSNINLNIVSIKFMSVSNISAIKRRG